MPQNNIIQNGSFDAGSDGWTGTDLETNFTEGAYVPGNSPNRVAELDGTNAQITVMQQTISIAGAQTTALTFRTALRSASAPGQGEGFRVDILDSDGNVIATQEYFPSSTGWVTQALPVSFPEAGTYTVRFTELGANDSLGAIVDDISMLVCFTAGTLIDTADGPRAVESLTVGDLIWTQDAGLQPLRWIGLREVSVAEQQADARLRPVVFAPGSLGRELPERRMMVSPQHRICMGDWRTELYFGQPEVLIPAHALVNGGTVRVADGLSPVTYVHFLLDGHQIVRSDGALTESFFPSALSLGGLDRAARDELFALFPDLASLRHAFPRTARRVLRGREARLVA
ncbi:Hint domain-containing protein [Fertoebacter nigrum]|uniref:Hint domain-containing protein n=1 Tax=Fertoeibacter niger TaxID=2656921 RepID=A0A8X8KP58_9RHOB|nr:Hint domain-containing protein [Fertoeibacter niger]NUB44775.1 Hint domain-containing protein [Fertoeibacter niger]